MPATARPSANGLARHAPHRTGNSTTAGTSARARVGRRGESHRCRGRACVTPSTGHDRPRSAPVNDAGELPCRAADGSMDPVDGASPSGRAVSSGSSSCLRRSVTCRTSPRCAGSDCFRWCRIRNQVNARMVRPSAVTAYTTGTDASSAAATRIERTAPGTPRTRATRASRTLRLAVNESRRRRVASSASSLVGVPLEPLTWRLTISGLICPSRCRTITGRKTPSRSSRIFGSSTQRSTGGGAIGGVAGIVPASSARSSRPQRPHGRPAAAVPADVGRSAPQPRHFGEGAADDSARPLTRSRYHARRHVELRGDLTPSSVAHLPTKTAVRRSLLSSPRSRALHRAKTSSVAPSARVTTTRTKPDGPS